MVGAHQNLYGSRDLPTPFLRWFGIRGLALATVNIQTKFEVSNSTHYEDIKVAIQNVENGVLWGS